jgi:hypothetical protein
LSQKLFYILTFVFLILIVLSVKVEKLENELDRCKSAKRVPTLSDSIPPRSNSSLERCGTTSGKPVTETIEVEKLLYLYRVCR